MDEKEIKPATTVRPTGSTAKIPTAHSNGAAADIAAPHPTGMVGEDTDAFPDDDKAWISASYIKKILTDAAGEGAHPGDIDRATRSIVSYAGELMKDMPIEVDGIVPPTTARASSALASTRGDAQLSQHTQNNLDELVTTDPSLTVRDFAEVVVKMEKEISKEIEDLKEWVQKQVKEELEKEKELFDPDFDPETCSEAELRAAIAKLETLDEYSHSS